jgi:predicted lipoprotein with Yx(FWY)xxD motif
VISSPFACVLLSGEVVANDRAESAVPPRYAPPHDYPTHDYPNSKRTKEKNDMKTQYSRSTTRRTAARSAAAGVTALLGVAASVVAPGVAGASTDHAAKSVVVSTVKNSKFGTLLVSGKTLYTLKASKTACSTACLKVWPELVLPKGVTKATAGSGASASKLGTISRSGGVLQVTYGGKPLY